MRKIYFLFLFAATGLFANSVRLYNDSPYKLKATILGADGSELGQLTILPEQLSSWNDSYSGGRQFSFTPYTVIWHCEDGNEYGITTNISTGGTTSAQVASGAKVCKPKKKQGAPSSQHPSTSLGQENPLE